MAHLDKEVFVCIDCETTGLDPKNDRIIEVAVVRFTLDQVLAQFESLIDPQMLIPEESIAIHHISNEMVQGKPTIDKVLPEIISLIGKHIIVGHGVGFDIELIANAADRHGIQHTLRSARTFDTLRLARLYGESPTNSLEMLRKHFNIEEEGAHRAMSDVTVNCEVFRYLSKNFRTTDQIFNVLSKPIKMKIMPLGKHKGRPIKEVPLQYLQWAANKEFDQDLLYSIRSEINRRKKGDLFGQATSPFADL